MSCEGCRRYLRTYITCMFINSYNTLHIKQVKCVCQDCLVKIICNERCKNFCDFYDKLDGSY